MLPTLRTALSLLLASALPAAAGTWYVDVNGTPPGAGSSSDPYTSIQYAIDQPTTVSGDTLLVLPGTYLEQVDYSGKSLILQSTGGAEVTTIDGSGACPLVGLGGVGSVVTIASGEAAPTRLEGFTVRGGCGTDRFSDGNSYGGGLLVVAATAEVVDCVVRDCLANEGGGIFCEDADLSLAGCGLLDDGIDPLDPLFGTARGGGMHAVDSVVELDSTSFVGNRAWGLGAGLFAAGSTLAASGCLFEDNVGVQYLDGGGVYLLDGSADFQLSSFRYNQTGVDGYGGAIHNAAATLTLTSCTFEHNEAIDRPGGAIYGDATASACLFRSNRSERGGAVNGTGTYDDCTFVDNAAYGSVPPFSLGFGGAVEGAVLLRRCLFVGNRTEGPLASHGGAVYGPAALVRCTLVGNEAPANGGVFDCEVRSSILRGNLPNQASPSSMVTYSNVEGGFPGTGNIDADPLFWDPALDDYHLMAGSPCIDAGAPADGPDPDGSPADMGAFVFDPGYCPTPASYCTSTTNSIGCSPAIAWSGEPTLTGADDFFVSASNLTNLQGGVLAWSLGSASTPFFGATLCLASPVVRTPMAGSGGNPTPYDCSGAFSFHFNQAYMASFGLAPGTAVHAQQWLRDPLDPSGNGIALSNGLRFLVCP